MKKKVVGIFVCTLLIAATVLPVAGTMKSSKLEIGNNKNSVPISYDSEVKWRQDPDPEGWDVYATVTEEDYILADDFPCNQSGPITKVTFWGSWKHDDIGQITLFNLRIYTNNASGPHGWSIPEDQKWEWETNNYELEEQNPSDQGWYNPKSGEYIENNHKRWFRYDIVIPEDQAFTQEGTPDEPVIYWLGIFATVKDPVNTSWGWKTALKQWQDAAVWGDGSDWWELRDLYEQKLDLSFEISTSKKCDVEITNITGGIFSRNPSLKLRVDLKNFGTEPRYDISWDIVFIKGFIVLGEKNGTIDVIPNGETVSIYSNPVIGLAFPGRVKITVDPPECGSTTKEKDVIVIALLIRDP